MCTVTWEKKNLGYRLLFNRDELSTREKALPPRVVEKSDIQTIMPIDSRAGGTWISANSAGISICLINNYGAEKRIHSDTAPSRGDLVSSMAFATTQNQAAETLLDLKPQRFNPFDIFIFDAHGAPFRWRWDGVDLTTDTPNENFAFSTGFDIDAVVSNRRNLYRQWQEQNRDLADYHRSHIPQASSYSVCMHREDARTQSMSEIYVEEKLVEFTYWPGPPCQTTALPAVKIHRQQHE